ncbi:MAG TPA: helix-turn-helix domain-containing protein [Steroidobacteraceae bacterium]|nr:helix-turn-helix domain-containing protein [Steroidobacteraceae bacterium]
MENPPANPVVPWQRGASPSEALSLLSSLGATRRFRVGEAVYLCNEPSEFWYQVMSGSGRRYAMTADGRRQIIEFLVPGDLFGFGGPANKHLFSVEAMTGDTTIGAYSRRSLERLVESDPGVARRVRELVLASIARIQGRVVTLGRTSALARVSTFLLEMADRFRAGPAGTIILPMSRYDIADYLCIAVETVSRALTELRERGVVHFGDIRSVQICDRCALEAFSEGSQPEKPDVRPSARTPLEWQANKARGRDSNVARITREVRLGLVLAERNGETAASRSA